ncbi:epm2a-interacting protein 1 [Holotrichia oblita]|uniref:Epm2a-interacting protein 1 n=1 Tax=Holotrichia oblita TaxID=644536 RepID=A0ACB9TUV4_HOLOL|nr:epm2a-interacting protein 1 [Holotrichia oblita]
MLLEREDIVLWRRRNLFSIKKYRTEQRPIYYLDEPWLSEGHTKAKVWEDVHVTTRRQACKDGVTTGLQNPVGKGRLLIILHIGSKNGFVDDGFLVFEGRKTADYHDKMDGGVFERWFNNILQKCTIIVNLKNILSILLLHFFTKILINIT